MKKLILPFTLALVLLMAVSPAFAQCPMCRATAESNLQHGGTAGKGLNTGILYMLAMPYVLVGAIGVIWWKNRITSQNDYPPVGDDQMN
ncbi:MAG: hypothetical protein KDC28_18285 [Saprospiraceae bacterium]|nr:hypothetical protein [Saprospiraceae bacterium]MCB9318542.1 hypothetical protein [Lewinellaceae bacterium]